MERKVSFNHTKHKYTVEKTGKLQAVRVAEDLYTPSHRQGLAFVNKSTNKVVVPTNYVDSLKLKKQMKDKR